MPPFITLAQAKFKEIKLKRTNNEIKKLSDALEFAAEGITKWTSTSHRCTYVYPDNSKLTIRLNGYCYLHDGWVKYEEKEFFICDEDMQETCTKLEFK